MAHAGVVVGDGGGDAVVHILDAATSALDTLRFLQVVVLDMDGVGEHVSVGDGVVVTRITGTRTTGWAMCDAATNPAGVVAHGGVFDVDGVLGACARLPEWIVLVVCTSRMVEMMEGMEGVGVVRLGLVVMPVEDGIRMVLCTDVGIVRGFAFCVVGAVVVDMGEIAEEIVDLVAEMVGEMGMVVVVVQNQP